jgi:hypothetical protein
MMPPPNTAHGDWAWGLWLSLVCYVAFFIVIGFLRHSFAILRSPWVKKPPARVGFFGLREVPPCVEQGKMG